MSDDKYQLCSCGSGKKFKFCCYEKRETLRGVSNETLARRAAEFPVDECHISCEWKERGLATVVVARRLPDGGHLVGVYLVDLFCLGIKEASVLRLKSDDMQYLLESCPETLQEISYEDARSVLMGATEFASRFGLKPYEGWFTSGAIVESDRLFRRKFEFGKDGKAFYIEGPHDDSRRIMKQLAPFVKKGVADYICLADGFTENIEGDANESVFDEWCDEISCLLEDGDFQTAREEIADILQDYPERWEPLYFKATCLALEGKAAKAISLFNRAIAIEPSAEAYLNLAGAHQSLFHMEEWIVCLKKVIELDGRAGPLGKLAQADLDDFASAIKKSDRLSLDQHLGIRKIFDRAFEDLNSGRFSEAVSGFSEVIKNVPHHVQSYGNLGLAYAALGDRARALECLDKAIAFDPGYQPAIDNRRILLAKAPDERLNVETSRQIDFYGDRARARSLQRAIPLRMASR